jgi:RNA polymerase sigma-70 factor, ECF subfamily
VQTLSDEQLILDLRLGDMEAFSKLYERYKQCIFLFCLKLTTNHPLAEDATHDTFIKMFENIQTLQDVSAFRSWLYMIARNQVYKILQKKKPNGQLTEKIVWNGTPPDTAVESLEEREMISKCLHVLKIEYREVLTLREYEQLSYEEIAAVTESSVSAVKSRLFKARRALAKQLKHYYL